MNTLAEILSSRVKAEVFRLLFGISEGPLHLREIERQSGLALSTVRQELERLIRLELVHTRLDGNRRLYTANRQHPLYPEIRNLVLKTTGLADVLREALASSPGIQVAFIFGSIARGSEQAHSDVDLMVIGSIGLRQLARCLSGVAGTLGREVNPHALTVDEFVRRKEAADHFVSTILDEPRIFIIGHQHDLEAVGG